MAGRTRETICNMALLYAGINLRVGNLDTDRTATAQACSTIYEENKKNLFSAFRWPFSVKRAQLTPFTGNLYDATHTYALGDMVQYGNDVYKSLQAANLNKQPDQNSSAAWWAQVTRDGWAFACSLPGDFLSAVSQWEKPTVSALASPPLFNYRDPSSFNLRNPESSERIPYAIENMNDGTDAQVFLTDVDQPILKYVANVDNPDALPTEFVEALAWRMAVAFAMGLRGDEKKAASCAVMATKKEAEAFVVSMRDQGQEDPEPDGEFVSARRGC